MASKKKTTATEKVEGKRRAQLLKQVRSRFHERAARVSRQTRKER